jgi:hypothetical protein
MLYLFQFLAHIPRLQFHEPGVLASSPALLAPFSRTDTEARKHLEDPLLSNLEFVGEIDECDSFSDH